jgi:hypothetical protein
LVGLQDEAQVDIETQRRRNDGVRGGRGEELDIGE